MITAARMIDGALHPLQRRRRREGPALIGGLAVRAERIGFVCRHRQQRIAPQVRMIVQILVAERQGVQSLRHQLSHPVLDETRVASVVKTTRQSAREPHRAIHLPQEQRPTVAAQVTTAEIGDDLARTQGLKVQRDLLTVCRWLGAGWSRSFLFHTNHFSTFRARSSTRV